MIAVVYLSKENFENLQKGNGIEILMTDQLRKANRLFIRANLQDEDPTKDSVKE